MRYSTIALDHLSYKTYHMNIDQRYESFQPRNKTLFVILILVPD